MFSRDATPTTDIYTLSLHDALPISVQEIECEGRAVVLAVVATTGLVVGRPIRSSIHRAVRSGVQIFRMSLRARAPRFFTSDRKSTRLNSSHQIISYAVFCLKKKKHT